MRTGKHMYVSCIKSVSLCILLLGSIFVEAQTGELFFTEDATPTSFPIATDKTIAGIYYDAADAKVVQIAAEAFSKDMQLVTGRRMKVSPDTGSSGQYMIIAGTIGHSYLINRLIKTGKLNTTTIQGKWESFVIAIVEHPFSNTEKALVIAGSDRRGTAYGIFHLSRFIGVSPFVWWADVAPARHDKIFISGSYMSSVPSVRYRGIFINDEDWGFQPWAAKKMDTTIKDIGPNTYAKVFELLLRLKANYIWPAMHPCTRAFYYYKDNPRVADEYAIIIGGSHCEPMLRNNVFEWAENFEQEYGKKPGEWRYDVNKDEIYRYWNDRVKQSSHYESVYTVGMRGIHDGSMPGPKDPDEKLKLLQNVINDQRKILGMDLDKPVQEVPQIFIPYKEVLSLYRRGLRLDDDITIIWPDDNHGYIRQLPNEQERKRSGGHGIYYHLSYWGSPQDYLWLCSTSPSLISYEMTKAYNYGADRLWVFNVGDIKPAELELQFAMDLAWDIHAWTPDKAYNYTRTWVREIFGEKLADDIAAIKNEYYLLAQSGKPEHMQVVDFSFPDARQRLDRYAVLAAKTQQISSSIPASLRDAWYQLVLYPVLCAHLMNQKILLTKISFGIGMPELKIPLGIYHTEKAKIAFDSIGVLTNIYNKHIAGGKWNGIMSWHPRDQPVFQKPLIKDSVTSSIADSLRKIYFKTPSPQLVIDAGNYVAKKETASTKLGRIKGLGINGQAVTRFAKNDKLDNDTAVLYADYAFSVSPGEYTVVVKCLPTFDVNTSKSLRYAIAVNNETPQVVNVHAEAESREWKENVLRGYSSGKTAHTIKSEANKLRIWFPDPNLVINTIEFYKK